jgi:hypothetical protein
MYAEKKRTKKTFFAGNNSSGSVASPKSRSTKRTTANAFGKLKPC